MNSIYYAVLLALVLGMGVLQCLNRAKPRIILARIVPASSAAVVMAVAALDPYQLSVRNGLAAMPSLL